MINPYELYANAYGTRLIVLIETGPQSNEYRQVILNFEDFKIVAKAVLHKRSLGSGPVPLSLGEEIIKLPDLREIKSEIQDHVTSGIRTV